MFLSLGLCLEAWAHLVGSADGRGGEGLQGRHRQRRPPDDGLEQGAVVQAGLALPADARHHLHRLRARHDALLRRSTGDGRAQGAVAQAGLAPLAAVRQHLHRLRMQPGHVSGTWTWSEANPQPSTRQTPQPPIPSILLQGRGLIPFAGAPVQSIHLLGLLSTGRLFRLGSLPSTLNPETLNPAACLLLRRSRWQGSCGQPPAQTNVPPAACRTWVLRADSRAGPASTPAACLPGPATCVCCSDRLPAPARHCPRCPEHAQGGEQVECRPDLLCCLPARPMCCRQQVAGSPAQGGCPQLPC